MDQNPTAESKTLLDLKKKAEYSRSCRACGVTIYFVRQISGKLLPFTYDGKPHWVNCSKPEMFRKNTAKPEVQIDALPALKKQQAPKPEQGSLFETSVKKEKGYPD